MEEYPFSIGGNDINLAMELIDGVEKFGVREDLFSKDGGSEDNVDNIDKVASPSAKGKGYSSAIGSERSEDNKEQSDITQTTKPMYEMKEKDLINAMRFHLMSYEKGIIDKDDVIQAMEELAYGDIKAPGIGEDNDPSGANLEGDPDEKVMGENGDVDDYTDELKESSQEESVADYIIDFYRNPNKPEETMVDEKIVDEYFKTHKDWDQEGRWDGSKEGMEAGMDDFNEFFDANYGYMFDDARDLDEDLKQHFKRFM